MNDSDEIKSSNLQVTAVVYFRTIFLTCLIISLIIIYIASEYFQTARLSQFISFQPEDAPGPMPSYAYPRPWGVHFFGDFLLSFRTAQLPSPYFADGFVPFSYLPFAAVLLGPFALFNYWTAVVLFFATAIILLILVLNWGLKHLQKGSQRLIILLFFASGPMFMMLDRGNVSLILTAICIFAVMNLQRGNIYIAAIAFGFSAAIKGYPLLFLLIFARRREWKQFLVGVSTFFMATLVPLIFYQKCFFSNLNELVRQFRAAGTPVHAINIRAFNNSLFSFLDTCRTSLPSALTNPFEIMVNNYSLFGILFAIILLTHAVSKHASDFDSLLLVTVAMVTIPQTVNYYVLLLYFVPLIFSWSEELQLNLKLKLIMAALAIVMVPKSVPLWSPFGPWSPGAATYTSFVNPLCALFISFVCVYSINRRRYSMFSNRIRPSNIHQD